MTDDLEQLRRELMRSAFLYDDPDAYRAGVEHTIAAMIRLRAAAVA